MCQSGRWSKTSLRVFYVSFRRVRWETKQMRPFMNASIISCNQCPAWGNRKNRPIRILSEAVQSELVPVLFCCFIFNILSIFFFLLFYLYSIFFFFGLIWFDLIFVWFINDDLKKKINFLAYLLRAGELVTGGAARWCGRRVADSTTRIRQRRTDSPNRRDVANQRKKERKKDDWTD